MPEFIVKTKDGRQFRIKGATPEEAHAKLTTHLQQARTTQTPERQNAPRPPAVPMNNLGVVGSAHDVAASVNHGLARGVASLAGAPGDIQDLVRAGMRKMGMNPDDKSVLDQIYGVISHAMGGTQDRLPTTQSVLDTTKAFAPQGVGDMIDYDPKTTAGRYASTTAEMLPSAAVTGGVGPANLVRYGVMPGVASEAAGQATEGTKLEPYARAAGAVLGPGAGRVISPITQNPRIAGSVQALEDAGVPLTAGQKTGSRPMRWLEEASANMPISAGMMQRFGDQQRGAINQAFAGTAGHTITDQFGRFTPEEWQAMRENFTRRYTDLTDRNTFNADRRYFEDVDHASRNYREFEPSTPAEHTVARWRNNLTGIGTQPVPGSKYQAWDSALTDDIKAFAGDPAANALMEMRAAMRDGMTRHMADQADAPLWTQLNRDYSNYKSLQAAGKAAGSNEGYISPAVARNVSAQKNTTRHLEGQSDIGNIAQAAQEVTKGMPNSGTAPIQLAMGGGGIGAGAAAGAHIAGLPGAIVGGALPAVVSLAVASRPGQIYLGNQLAQRMGIGGPRQMADYAASVAPAASALNDQGPVPVQLPRR